MSQKSKHDWATGRLRVRPAPPTRRRRLGLTRARYDGRLCPIMVPWRYRRSRPAPLLIWLHGGSGRVEKWTAPLWSLAQAAGVVIIAPKSKAYTWDRTASKQFGPDTQAIDKLMAMVIESHSIDPVRVGIGGFSDGATYALSLGLTNGEVFTHILAISPGGMNPAERRGRPKIFVTHGTKDQTLRIDRCSRSIVPHLKEDGYDVNYRETGVAHTPAVQVVPAALRWFQR